MCPSYLDGDQTQTLAGFGLGDTRSHRSCERRFVGMIVQFSRSARGAHPDWVFGLSKLNSMRLQEQAQNQAPGSVDIRYRVELEVDGMPTWPSPALQVLELP